MTRAEALFLIAAGMVGLAVVWMGIRPGEAGEPGIVRCRENLRRLGAAARAYAQDHGGALPVTQTVVNPHRGVVEALARYEGDPRVYYCPSQQELRYSAARFGAGEIGYYYYGALLAPSDDRLSRFLRTEVEWPRLLTTAMDPKTWVMSDVWVSGVPTAHAETRKGVNYLTVDGAVDFVAASPRQDFR